jgi:hypothetical protein
MQSMLNGRIELPVKAYNFKLGITGSNVSISDILKNTG